MPIPDPISTDPLLTDLTVAVVGLGLMGASLALALRGQVRALYGVDTDPATRAAAAPLLDRVSENLADGLADADVVILATPPRTILRLLDPVGSAMQPGALLLDLASTKAQIVAAMASLPPGLFAIGGHPMCGKETSGFAAAEPGLYVGCTFALCETGRAETAQRALAEALVRGVGGRPFWIAAAAHDQAVAVISHLPYLLSMGLVAQVANDPARDTLFALASSGFRDTSRLAGSDLAMMTDVMATNTDAIWRALADLQTQLTALLAAFSNDGAADRAWLTAIRERRRAWGEHFAKRTR